MQKRLIGLTAVFALTVPFVAFAQSATPEATPEMDMMVEPIELEAVDPLAFDGDIVTAGSSTVFPLTERMAERFIEEGFAGEITVDSIGTGAGFERFCEAGETDIANASRAIRDSEAEACGLLATPRTPIEFRVGTDALAVVVSNENDFLDDISIAQLTQIYSGEVTMWNELDPSFPAETIQVFSPGSDSGTYDYFLEVTLEADAEDGGLGIEAEEAESLISAVPGIQFSEDDNVLVQGVQGSPFAIAYFGYAFYNENEEQLKALSVNGVLPTEETAENGEYPIARPLFIYSDAAIIAEKPQVGAFISFYLSNVNDEILDVGYFPASVEALNEAKTALMEAMGMGM
jgi:phosphate binding protein